MGSLLPSGTLYRCPECETDEVLKRLNMTEPSKGRGENRYSREYPDLLPMCHPYAAKPVTQQSLPVHPES